MKLRHFSLVIFLLLINLSILAQDSVRIGLINPTIKNIKTFSYLINNKLIKNKEAKLVAICYSHSDYDYQKSKEFVTENHLKNIDFITVEGEIFSQDIFKENNCTQGFKNAFEQTDALIFPGGDDLPAYTYGEETSLTNVNLNPGRHYFELSFLYHLYGGFQKSNLSPLMKNRPNYVVLGICLGAQTMSTAAGGTMIQDIPSEIYGKKSYDEVTKQDPQEIHRSPWYNIYSESDILSCSFHKITMNTDMQRQFKNMPTVLSCHHQAIDQLGKNFVAWAWSPDKKVIEGIQNKIYPNVFAVQFHPEATILYKETLLKIKPNEEAKNIPSLLNEKDKNFHKEFWAYFSEKLQNSIVKK